MTTINGNATITNDKTSPRVSLAEMRACLHETATLTNDKTRLCVSLYEMRACLRNNNGIFGGNFAKVYATWYGGTPIGAV